MSDSPLLRTLLATFALPLRPAQISQWRGAFVARAGRELDLLHNHAGDEGLHYRYPLIQYRARQGQAAIFALNEGAMVLYQALAQPEGDIHWQGAPRPLRMNGLQLKEWTLRLCEDWRIYHLHRWVALNDDNYRRWLDQPRLADRANLLEECLTAHLLKFASAVGWQLPAPLEVELRHLRRESRVRVHGQHLLAFDVVYAANLDLPPLISLGKATSLGFGWQIPERTHATRGRNGPKNQTEDEHA